MFHNSHGLEDDSPDPESYCARISAALDLKLSFTDADEGAGRHMGGAKVYSKFYVDNCDDEEEDLECVFSSDLCQVLPYPSCTSQDPTSTVDTTQGGVAEVGVTSPEYLYSNINVDEDDGWDSDIDESPPLASSTGSKDQHSPSGIMWEGGEKISSPLPHYIEEEGL